MIYIQPADVWEYYQEHEKELCSSMKIIAERNDFGVEIFLTQTSCLPCVMVTIDNEEATAEVVRNEKECAEIVSEFYDEYLSDDFLSELISDSDDYTIPEQLDLIDEREAELDEAVYMLLDTFIQITQFDGNADDLCDDIKEHLCEYLFREHNISVYRPMYLECEDGTDEFSEFPYDEMEFE